MYLGYLSDIEVLTNGKTKLITLTKQTMKKLFKMSFLSLAVALSVAACNSNQSASDAADSAADVQTEAIDSAADAQTDTIDSAANAQTDTIDSAATN